MAGYVLTSEKPSGAKATYWVPNGVPVESIYKAFPRNKFYFSKQYARRPAGVNYHIDEAITVARKPRAKNPTRTKNLEKSGHMSPSLRESLRKLKQMEQQFRLAEQKERQAKTRAKNPRGVAVVRGQNPAPTKRTVKSGSVSTAGMKYYIDMFRSADESWHPVGMAADLKTAKEIAQNYADKYYYRMRIRSK
jgi:hypothetical protein